MAIWVLTSVRNPQCSCKLPDSRARLHPQPGAIQSADYGRPTSDGNVGIENQTGIRQHRRREGWSSVRQQSGRAQISLEGEANVSIAQLREKVGVMTGRFVDDFRRARR